MNEDMPLDFGPIKIGMDPAVPRGMGVFVDSAGNPMKFFPLSPPDVRPVSQAIREMWVERPYQAPAVGGTAVTITMRGFADLLMAMGDAAGKAAAQFALLIRQARSAQPKSPASLIPPDCVSYCYPRVEWARMRRMDRDRRRAHRRAVRRHKRLPPAPRRSVFIPHATLRSGQWHDDALVAEFAAIKS